MKTDKVASNIKELIQQLDGKPSEIIKDWSFAQNEDGTYERVKAKHSWNSDHPIGRILLFELTRHSDHHYNGAKAYQVLNSKSESPLLPYGYPAMLILSYFPFIFIPVMNRHLKSYELK